MTSALSLEGPVAITATTHGVMRSAAGVERYSMNKMEDQTDIKLFMPYLEACAEESRIIIEIGIGHGNGSTRAFARGLAKREGPRLHVCVDHQISYPLDFPNNEYTKLFHEDSRSAVLPAHVHNCICLKFGTERHALVWPSADIIFIDTHHVKEQLATELRTWDLLADRDTIWLFHDTWMNGEYNPMVDAIHEYIQDRTMWKYSDLSKDSHGLGAMWARKAPRPFDRM